MNLVLFYLTSFTCFYCSNKGVGWWKHRWITLLCNVNGIYFPKIWDLFLNAFNPFKMSGPICVSRVAFLNSRYYKPLLLFSLWLLNNMLYTNSWKSWELQKTLEGYRETNEGSMVSGQVREFSDAKFVQPSCVTTEMRMLCIKRENNLITDQWFRISVFPAITLTFCPFWL